MSPEKSQPQSSTSTDSLLLQPECVLEAEHLGIKFSRSLGAARRNGLGDFTRAVLGLQRTPQARSGEFWALRDVSFRLKRQETLGVMGLNGSGKSTLLKIISGVFPPDEGRLTFLGATGGLIELGAGFHPDLSGRENIFIKSALLGMRRDEVRQRIEDVIAFSELGEYIDAPLRTYSSGMLVRLGFAIVVHTESDILLMDEVLAVGDFRFRQKCMERLNAMRERASVILVSHSEMNITRFCDRALVLDKGRLAFDGNPDDAVRFYTDTIETPGNSKQRAKAAPARKFYGDIYHNPEKIEVEYHFWSNCDAKPVERVGYGRKFALEFSFLLKGRCKELIVGVPVWTTDGVYVTGMATDQSGVSLQRDKQGWVRGRLVVDPVMFNPGAYVSVLSIATDNEFVYRQLNPVFTVDHETRRFGVVHVPHYWENGERTQPLDAVN